MNSNLPLILQAATSIPMALLRFQGSEEREALLVRVAFATDQSLCVIPVGMRQSQDMRNQRVHLIQKNEEDYFFISGYLKEPLEKNHRILPLKVTRASWFIRKNRGSVSWFREKHMFQGEDFDSITA